MSAISTVDASNASVQRPKRPGPRCHERHGGQCVCGLRGSHQPRHLRGGAVVDLLTVAIPIRANLKGAIMRYSSSLCPSWQLPREFLQRGLLSLRPSRSSQRGSSSKRQWPEESRSRSSKHGKGRTTQTRSSNRWKTIQWSGQSSQRTGGSRGMGTGHGMADVDRRFLCDGLFAGLGF